MDESDGSGWLQRSRDFAVLGEHERLLTGSCGINITFSILWSKLGTQGWKARAGISGWTWS